MNCKLQITNYKSFLPFCLFAFLPFYLCAFLPNTSYAQGFSLPKNPLEGRKVFFSKNCVKCHTIWGEGEKLGPDLSKIGKEKTFMQLVGHLWSHSSKMTELMRDVGIKRPTLSPKEIERLLAYIYFINYFNEPGNSKTGEFLFAEKGCRKCHSIGDKGGNIAPELDTFKQYMSPIALAQALWNHGPQMLTQMGKMGIKTPQFEKTQLEDMLAYIRSYAIDTKQTPEFMLAGNPTNGKKLFISKKCSKCHATETQKKSIAPNLRENKLNKSATEIASRMLNHDAKMWSIIKASGMEELKFENNELADIISYIYFLNYFDKNGDINKGRELFSQKKCSACHSIKGRGGIVGPELSESKTLKSTLYIAAAMWNHAPNMEKLLKEKNIEWPTFFKNEMRDLITYLQASVK